MPAGKAEKAVKTSKNRRTFACSLHFRCKLLLPTKELENTMCVVFSRVLKLKRLTVSVWRFSNHPHQIQRVSQSMPLGEACRLYRRMTHAARHLGAKAPQQRGTTGRKAPTSKAPDKVNSCRLGGPELDGMSAERHPLQMAKRSLIQWLSGREATPQVFTITDH